MEDGKYAKCYYDTMVTNIFNINNINDVNNNSFTIFNAGLYGQNRKFNNYIGKFEEYNDKGYRFYPLIMESYGGMNKHVRCLINQLIKENSCDNEEFAIKIKNYYIEFRLYWIKVKYKSMYSHIQ